MLKKGLYLVGRTIAGLMWLGAAGGLLLVYGGPAGVSVQPGALYLAFVLATAAGAVAHELGHLLACLAVGAKVKTFQLGHERAAIRFRVRGVQVFLGWPFQGRVTYEGMPSVGRRMVITLAGPLMDLTLAGLVLISLGPAPSWQGLHPLVVATALGLSLTGLVNLMPFRTRSGRLSDGARLFELRSDVRAEEAVAVQKTSARLLKSQRAPELLKLHAGLEVPAGRMSVRHAAALTMIEFNVVLLPGLPDADASLAEQRVSSLVRSQDPGPAEPLANLTLALLRLRAGGPANHATAERFCDQALAGKDVTDYVRRMALAAVIVSRQARGLPYEDVLATAAATLKTAGHGPEAIAAGLKAIIDPAGFLGAFRAGAPDARLGAGSLAIMLRGQGRIGELLELHKGFGVPEGRYAAGQTSSLHEVEYNLLLVPCVPREAIDEVASRMAWILDSYPFEAEPGLLPRPDVQHTLALARLRQGRFDEVEPLCAPGLATDYGPDARATILATIVLARRALGRPHADLLGEAMRMSPDADLVAEAALGTVHEEAADIRAPH